MKKKLHPLMRFYDFIHPLKYKENGSMRQWFSFYMRMIGYELERMKYYTYRMRNDANRA